MKKYGLGLGAGVRYSMTNALQIGLQAEHQAYESATTSSIDNGGNHSLSTSVTPQQNVVDLDLFYHF